MNKAKSLITMALVMSLVFTAAAGAADIAGSADFPGIGRFEGSEIEFYEVENYGSTTMANGPVLKQSGPVRTVLIVEGAVTRIVYKVPQGASAHEVFRNFNSRITEAGFNSIISGGPERFDYYTFMYKHPVEKLQNSSMSNEIWYLSAEKTTGDSRTFVSLIVSPDSGGDGQRARLIAVTTKAM